MKRNCWVPYAQTIIVSTRGPLLGATPVYLTFEMAKLHKHVLILNSKRVLVLFKLFVTTC